MSDRTNDPDKPINVAIPPDDHALLKRDAARRGMKLRPYVRYLIHLAQQTTPKQQRDAMDAFVAESDGPQRMAA